jgi:hypothetical protein
MIVEEITKPPYIHFGLGKESLTIEIGQSFKIFQRNVYLDDYEFKINNAAATYENEFTASAIGETTYKVTMINKLSSVKEIDGNIIALEVVGAIASSNKILASSNLIKADGGI